MLGPLGTIKQAREAAKTQHSQKYLKKKKGCVSKLWYAVAESFVETWKVGKRGLLNMRNFVESSQPNGPKAEALIFNFSCSDCSYSCVFFLCFFFAPVLLC